MYILTAARSAAGMAARMVVYVALASAGVTIMALESSAGSASTSAQEVTISTGDLYFCDPGFQDGVCETSVTAGGTVNWNVIEGFHTVTQCSGGYATCPTAGGFDSGVLNAGQDYSQAFPSPGTIEYICLVHPDNMRGRIVTEAAPTNAPAQPDPSPAAPTTTASSPAPGTTTEATDDAHDPFAALPSGGGSPGDGGSSPVTWPTIVLGGLLIAASSLAIRAARRSNHDQADSGTP